MITIILNNNNNIDNTNNFIQWGNEHITSSETSKLEDVKKYIWSEIPNLTGTDPLSKWQPIYHIIKLHSILPH